MNRFEYLESKLFPNEIVVAKEKNAKIYHGNEKVLQKITTEISDLISKL